MTGTNVTQVEMNGKRYSVMLESNGNHTVKVTKQRSGGGEYQSTIKPHSANWNRAVKLAYQQTGLARS